jgi:uncharacterized protein DUF4019
LVLLGVVVLGLKREREIVNSKAIGDRMKKISGVALLVYFTLGLSWVFADDAAEKAAAAWLAQIDAGKYATSWKEASAYFRGAVSEKSWSDALTGTRKPLAKLLTRKLAHGQSATSLPGAPDGTYFVMQFDASFSNKKGAVETVTFMQEKDGKWRAAGYYIK